MKSIKLVIDNKVLNEYNEYYFLCHPRARVARIKEPYHPSINKWMIMQRQAMNDTKQRWKDFMLWFIEKCGYKDLHISECEMIFTTYFKTTIRHDPDNTVPKFLLDGLAESGFIIDDDSKHLKSLTLKCDYDKNNERTEIDVIKIKLMED